MCRLKISDEYLCISAEQRILDIMKIDTEGAEWSAIAQMAENGEFSQIRQLTFEFHVWQIEKVENYRYFLKLLGQIDAAGFKIFYSHMYQGWSYIIHSDKVYPNVRTLTYEVSFVNTNLKRS